MKYQFITPDHTIQAPCLSTFVPALSRAGYSTPEIVQILLEKHPTGTLKILDDNADNGDER